MLFIFGQIVGGLAILLGVYAFQAKEQRQLLFRLMLTNGVFAVHFLLLGAWTGAAINALSAIRSGTYLLKQKKGSVGYALPVLFAALMGVVGILTWEAWYSLFMVLCMVINTLCVAFLNAQRARISSFITSPLAILYDVFVLSFGGVVFESAVILSCAVGLWRHASQKELPSHP
ncbi:MAG: YgjV family protein [Clostridia bacterium]|nr:YgjV family protein [Clostridia bacterium]